MTDKAAVPQSPEMPGGKYTPPAHDLKNEFSPEKLIEDKLNYHDVTLEEADEIIKNRHTAPGVDISLVKHIPDPPENPKEGTDDDIEEDLDNPDDAIVKELQDMSNKLSEVLQTTLIPIVDCIGKACDLIQEMEVKKNGYKKKYEDKCKAVIKLKKIFDEI